VVFCLEVLREAGSLNTLSAYLLGVVILRVLVMLSMLIHIFGCRNTEYCSDAECRYVKCQF
jgi:hypothetical protein